MTNRKFNPVRKDRWFYDQYEYCMGFFLDEVSCLRVLDHACIDDTMARRKQWREIAQQRWLNGRQNSGVILRHGWRDITETTINDLHALASVLLETNYKFKLVVGVNQGYVYTNDTALIEQLDLMPELNFKTYTRAQIVRPKNTVELRDPQYAFRSYFKTANISGHQKDQLMDFLHNQRGQVRPSPGLMRWFDLPFNRTQDYFFVDHNCESWLTMLNLVAPGIIRKTMHIIPAK